MRNPERLTTTGTALVFGLRPGYTEQRPAELKHLATTIANFDELPSGPLDAPGNIAAGSVGYLHVRDAFGRPVICFPAQTTIRRPL